MQVVVCSHEQQSLVNKAHLLAERLQWPVVMRAPANATIALVVEPDYVALSIPSSPQFKPLYLNFSEGKQAYRLSHVNQEQLVRTCRVKGLDRPLRIIDATAGLGRDSLLLAASGACVTMLEQSLVLSCLLEDLIVRLTTSERAYSLQLHAMNALDYLSVLTEEARPDVIYLDPMFDHDLSKTALVKKDLQMLQVLAKPPSLAEQTSLLEVARASALVKVVVKRARLADPLAKSKPHHQILGTHSRFDVYTRRT